MSESLEEYLEEYMERIGCETVEDYRAYLREKWSSIENDVVEVDGHPVLKVKS